MQLPHIQKQLCPNVFPTGDGHRSRFGPRKPPEQLTLLEPPLEPKHKWKYKWLRDNKINGRNNESNQTAI
jgi:hypothetical protein